MRYAIYYTPNSTHPLSKCVATWLGRDAFEGIDIKTSHGLDDHLTSPRRYGFHGTLKAPFHLSNSATEANLVEEFKTFARQHKAFLIDKLVLSQLGPFFALTPSSQNDDLRVLGESAVKTFEPFRAPLTEEDRARRNPEALTPNQRAHLDKWGYPYVMDEFRFHLTLTNKISDSHSRKLRDAIEKHFADFLNKPLEINTLGLFVEPERGAPFTVKHVASLA